MNSLYSETAFIAVGQAGGNIACELEKRGFSALYINTSQADLDTLRDAKNKYHIAGGEGTGKDRNRAKELLAADFRDLISAVQEKISQEFIFVVFSAGGGTGSGSAPMLTEYLSQALPGRTVGAVAVLPAVSESLRTQANAYECFQELRRLAYDAGVGAMFLIDNNGHGDKMKLNAAFADSFEALLKVPEAKDPRGNIDATDLKGTLRAHGCTVITRLEKRDSSTNKLLESFKNNIFAPAEQDGVIECILLSMASPLDLNVVMKNTGLPVDTFIGYNQTETVCALSGLSFPEARLDSIEKRIAELRDQIQKNHAQKTPVQEKVIDLNFGPAGAAEPRTIRTEADIFAKYLKK